MTEEWGPWEYFTRMDCEDPLGDHPMAAPLTYRQSTLRVRRIRWKGEVLSAQEVIMRARAARNASVAVEKLGGNASFVNRGMDMLISWSEPRQ